MLNLSDLLGLYRIALENNDLQRAEELREQILAINPDAQFPEEPPGNNFFVAHDDNFAGDRDDYNVGITISGYNHYRTPLYDDNDYDVYDRHSSQYHQSSGGLHYSGPVLSKSDQFEHMFSKAEETRAQKRLQLEWLDNNKYTDINEAVGELFNKFLTMLQSMPGYWETQIAIFKACCERQPDVLIPAIANRLNKVLSNSPESARTNVTHLFSFLPLTTQRFDFCLPLRNGCSRTALNYSRHSMPAFSLLA